MRKKLLLFQTLSLSLSLGLVPLGCLQLDTNHRLFDISNIDMPASITTKVNLGDSFQEVLTNDSKGSFKSVLLEVFGDFANLHNISLRYGSDYNITISDSFDEDIDPYSKISEYQIIKVTVFATMNNNKIKGKFVTPVNLIRKPKSITEIAIPKQIFNGVVVDETSFLDILRLKYFEMIKLEIKKIEPEAVRSKHYAVNVEGHKRKDKITEEDLKSKQYINVNAITNDPINNLLEGYFSFELELSADF